MEENDREKFENELEEFNQVRVKIKNSLYTENL
jgi:hypothetical protein